MIKFDYEKCNSCMICLKSCGSRLLKEDPQSNQPHLAYDFCSDCGHCVSVCPQGAISLENKEASQIPSIKDHSIKFQDFLNLTKARRSYRIYQKKSVPNHIIERIIHSTQYLPTGSNAQELQFTILTDPDRIKKLATKMNQKFKLAKFITNTFPMKQLFRFFLPKKKADRIIDGPERLTTNFENGYDTYLRGAPTVIIIHTDQRTEMMHLDAGIAGHHINLACEIEGLGMCWVGFHSELARYFPSIKKISLIPRNHKVLATMVIGYPLLKYLRECPRKDVQINLFNK